MAEDLIISEEATKEEKYKSLLPQIKALTSIETDVIANLSNIAAALKTTFDFYWVGFYVKKGNELVLAPFQGPVACTRIAFNKGVCGASYSQKKTVIVPNVDDFPGHVACSSASKSEIVLPIFKDENVVMVLDLDSDKLHDFDETDKQYLEELCQYITKLI